VRRLVAWAAGLLLLRDHIDARWPHARGLEDDLTVLRPHEVRPLRRLGIERAWGIGLELAFVPLLADSEIQRPGEDHGRAPLVGVPVRHNLGARRELGSLNIHTRFGGVTVQDRVSRARAHGCLELNVIGKFEDGLGALRKSSRCRCMAANRIQAV
jgi:hypothetical protein